MYKSNKFRRVIKPPSAPLPVILSQKPVEGNNKDEDIISNSQDSQEEIPKPSGQRENASQISLASQSRFLSQRHQISRLTQEHEIRGKNYFEIALNVCKIQITDMGKLHRSLQNSINIYNLLSFSKVVNSCLKVTIL